MNPSSTPENDAAHSAEDRRLEALLRAYASDYIDDAGFTAAVIGRLPHTRQVQTRRRLCLLGGALVLGVAAVAVLAGPALVEQGRIAGDWLRECGSRPVPYFGDLLSLALLAVGFAGAAFGLRACSRES